MKSKTLNKKRTTIYLDPEIILEMKKIVIGRQQTEHYSMSQLIEDDFKKKYKRKGSK